MKKYYCSDLGNGVWEVNPEKDGRDWYSRGEALSSFIEHNPDLKIVAFCLVNSGFIVLTEPKK